ncbi:MAG: acetyltransferase [Rhizobiaceae bacterium]|jgi:aminoglycoside 6'-N-acetyltransferase|nr:acetyltransferase [Rhizobiaceae bacterium]
MTAGRTTTAAISFRSVEPRDMALIRRWAAQPHWLEWWGAADKTVSEIGAAMDEDSTEPMIALLGNRPVAYVQTYDPHLEEAHPYQDQPFGTLGLDISIGDAADLGQGLGTAIILALAGMLFEEGVPRLIIDPDPANLRAIRAYEKAGFMRFDERASEFGPALMMAKDNPEFALDE